MIRGNLFVISAPSGAGKTTLLKQILTRTQGITFSISTTTRNPRDGEKDGVDYNFVEKNEFEKMREDNAFLDWAEVHGNYYGTSREAIEKELDAGLDILLDIDVQGARQIKESGHVKGLFIFIAAPSLKELEKRLTGRRTESEETIKIRLENARKEIAQLDMYDYVIVNDKLEDAIKMLQSIILSQRSRNRRSTSGEPLSLGAITGNE